MRILAVVQGNYGQRMVDNIQQRGPDHWELETFRPPPALPIIVDDPEDFLPPERRQADLALTLIENPTTAQLIPAIARLAGVKAVLCPIDNSAWVPTGLKNQLQRELADIGIESVFPKPFCTLTEKTAGYRRIAEPYTSATVSEFARYFGRPKLDVTVDGETGLIQKIEVIRGATCGSTDYAAKELEGTPVDEAVPKAGLLSHQYPCLASMEREQIDDRLVDTLMHVSGYVVNEEMEEKLRPYLEKPQYFTPDQELRSAD